MNETKPNKVTAIEGHKVLFCPGAIVELKSGGPPMTLDAVTPEKAYCIWHNSEGDMIKDWVPIACLKVRG